MALETTLSIIKPDAVAKKVSGRILSRLEEQFNVVAMKKLHLTREQAQAFYAVHKERPFYPALIDFMTSGPVVVLALEGEDAIKRYRELMGATDSTKAAAGTIRKDFGTDMQKNAVHGSDSVENGIRETRFFFAP
ncbi:MAG: nucleoside-diphosphate kinase [Spirochaetes bacterium]|nr:nucleoside-diphosphate kinase [Spirochaetota bacterium]